MYILYIYTNLSRYSSGGMRCVSDVVLVTIGQAGKVFLFFFSRSSMSNGSQDFWNDRRAPNINIDSPRAKKETDEASKKTETSGFKPAGLKPPEASKPSDIKLKMDDTIKV